MLQIILTLVIFVLLIIPIGRYMFHIATGQHTFCDPVFNRIDNGIYRICGINQNEGMGWKKYALALVLTNAVMVFIGYLILRIQFLPVSCCMVEAESLSAARKASFTAATIMS